MAGMVGVGGSGGPVASSGLKGIGVSSTINSLTVDCSITCDARAGSSMNSGYTMLSTSVSCDGCVSGSTSLIFFDLVVLARFDLEVLLFVAPAFRFPLLVAVDILDITEMLLVSIDSSRSGILGASDCMVIADCVDSLVETLDVREAREARPFLAFGLLDGAVLPAKTKKGQLGDLE